MAIIKFSNEYISFTVIIRIAENMLFDVFVLSGVVIVFEPHGHGEISRQIVRHDFRRNSHACCSVKHENLATLTKKNKIIALSTCNNQIKC